MISPLRVRKPSEQPPTGCWFRSVAIYEVLFALGRTISKVIYFIARRVSLKYSSSSQLSSFWWFCGETACKEKETQFLNKPDISLYLQQFSTSIFLRRGGCSWSSGQRNVSGYRILFVQPHNIVWTVLQHVGFSMVLNLDVLGEMQNLTRELCIVEFYIPPNKSSIFRWF